MDRKTPPSDGKWKSKSTMQSTWCYNGEALLLLLLCELSGVKQLFYNACGSVGQEFWKVSAGQFCLGSVMVALRCQWMLQSSEDSADLDVWDSVLRWWQFPAADATSAGTVSRSTFSDISMRPRLWYSMTSSGDSEFLDAPRKQGRSWNELISILGS